MASEAVAPQPQAARSAVVVGVSSSGNYLAGRHAQSLRDFDSAAGYMERALGEDPGNVTLMRNAYRLKLAKGEIAAAAEMARTILKSDPTNPLANLGLVVEDVKTGHFADGAKRLENLPAQGLNTFLAPLMRAWALAGLAKPDEAVAALAPLKTLSGFAVLYDLHVGLIQDVAGRTDDAIASLRAAEAASGDSALRIVQMLGSLYERTGRGGEARALYDKYIAENPDTVILEAAMARLGRGEVPKPIVANARQGMAEALLNLGGTLTGDNTAEVAMVCGRLALYLRPDLDLARMLVAGVFETQGREAEANKLYDEVAPATSLGWLARMRRAANLDAMDETEKAIAALRAMSDERPTRVDALINLGDLLRVHKRFAESVEAYDRAVARIGAVTQRHWSILYSRGISLERSNQWARAEKDLLQALELNPDQPYVLNYLGYSWVDKGLHLDRARRMIEKAVELRPTDGYIVDSLGWLFFRTGKYKDAVDNLERAVELKPQDPVINDHLGDAYWRVGRTDEARFQWRRALTLEPEQELISELRAKLVRGLAAVKKSNNDI